MNNKITLYQAVIGMQNRIMSCVDEDGVLDIDRVGEIEATFNDKATAYVAVNKTLLHNAFGLKAQRDAVLAEYNTQIGKLEANAERIKESLYAAMKSTGTTSIKSDDGLLSATLYSERDESVELDADAVFPPELCVDPKPPAPSKQKIKAAILAGEPVAGARIVRRDRLTIK